MKVAVTKAMGLSQEALAELLYVKKARAVFQDYRSEGAGDAAEADQGTGISLYFSLLGG